jgi:hypothetical protein
LDIQEYLKHKMSEVLVFTLEKKAKSAGGDKYVCETLPEFNIYVPQSISRKENSQPSETLHVTITPQVKK